MLDLNKITKYMSELDEEKLFHYVKLVLESRNGERESKKIIHACQEGMKNVGNQFEAGEYFIGDLIYAGELMNDVVDLIKPYINRYTWKTSGRIVLGSVEGDLHDIGKNIFRGMANAAGFEVLDIGIDQTEKKFIKAILEFKPDIVGISGVLTSAVEPIRRTVKAIESNGLRGKIKIIIGGSCVSKQVCDYTGVDDYTLNAAKGIETCIQWMNISEIAI